MARHGENIRKRNDGRWEGRYKEYSPQKEIHIYRSVYGKSYEEVREKLTLQKNLQKKIPGAGNITVQNQISAKSLLFHHIAEEWLEETYSTKKLSTYEKYRVIYQRHLAKHFQDVTLSDLTEQYVRARISAPLSDSIKKSVYCVLNQILKFASVRYSVTVPEIKRPVSTVRNKPVIALSKAELKRLFEVLYKGVDRFGDAVLLCLFTGLRLGEVCALKWSDIDFAGRLITVNRTVQRLYAEGYGTKTVLLETEPKSECSRREIPISTAAMELLLQRRKNEGYVFGEGGPLEPRTLQYHFKKIIKEAQLPCKNFHILRHTFATSCIEGNMDVKSLSEILGHANVQITLNRYVHPTMDTKQKLMEGLSVIYGQNCGQAC